MNLTKDNATLTTYHDNSQRSKGLFLKVLIMYTVNSFFYYQYCKFIIQRSNGDVFESVSIANVSLNKCSPSGSVFYGF